jgi:DNA-binding CsgD family transcriptional regulator
MNLLSNYLLTLYRGALEKPTHEFRDWTLNGAKSLIPFDSCVWGSGSWANNQPSIHTVHLHQLNGGFIQSWLEHHHEDRLARDMPLNINRTFNVNVADEYAGTAIYNHHCKQFGMEHIVATATIDEDTLLLNTMSLYRSDPDHPFSERERILKEALFPHLIEAVRMNWLTNLPHILSPKQRSSFNSIAACDTTGILQVAMPSFVDACRQEWPAWKGPSLPSCVIEVVQARLFKYVGNNVVLNMHPMDNLLLLRARSKVPADGLSTRELEVAQQFAEGIDHKSIAQALSLSPSTIRTHINNIYTKLEINNKANLASALSRLAH